MAVVVNCIRISSLVACAKSQDLNEQRTEFQIIAAVLFSVDRFFFLLFFCVCAVHAAGRYVSN